MKLLLTSSGVTNKSIKKALSELIILPFKKTNFVFIPTAANGEEGDKSWVERDINKFKALGFATFEVIDISAISQDIWLPIFEKADVLVFGGGNTKYLIDSIKKSGLHDHLPKLLENRIYVGISAGSIVTGKTISLSKLSLVYREETGNLDETKGLGFIDFGIKPHLNSKLFPKSRLEILEKLAKEIDAPFYAIDDNTAIRVEDGAVSIISEGEWKRFN